MTINIICIGDELLNGDTLNTNLRDLGESLASQGLTVNAEQCVPDSETAIRKALENAADAQAVILIGGLGATKDDLTRTVTADFLGRPLQVDEQVLETITAFLGRPVANQQSLRIQAQVPEGATVLPNPNGTAPGLMLQQNGTLWCLLPGPPRECIPMLKNQLLPRLLQAHHCPIQAETLRIRHLPEPAVDAIAQQVLADTPQVSLAICLKTDHILIRLTAPRQDGDNGLKRALDGMRKAFAADALPPDCTSAAQYLGQILASRNLVMATAESCTGGGIAQALTAIPGSSEWFVGGVVTYANQWKQHFLGVTEDTLRNHGAVSEETVHQMLDGLRDRCQVPAGVAVSGIAGPGGGTPQKPVGTVVIGAFGPGWKTVRTMHYPGQRDTVRQRATAGCINLLLDGLLTHAEPDQPLGKDSTQEE